MIKGSQPDNAQEDQHNQPTEPMPRLDVGTLDPTTPSGPGQIVLPAPPAYEQSPFPGPYAQGKGSKPPVQVYPVLPPAPVAKHGGRPAGGAWPAYPARKNQRNRSLRKRRSPLPALLGLYFVFVQLLLLARFVLKLIDFNLAAYQTWISMVYVLSEPLLIPFRALWLMLLTQIQIPLQIPVSLEIYTLLAILGYGLISRILVHLLKVLFNAH